MKESRYIMGMPITVEIVGADQGALDTVFNYFHSVDERFSTYKPESEIMQINRGEIAEDKYSDEMKEVFARAKQTEQETLGYFSIQRPDGLIDPSGLVKGWAIRNATKLVQNLNYTNFYIDVGGDIQSSGVSSTGKPWTFGIRNPFRKEEIVKVIDPKGRGVATSGTYVRGEHIYNPHKPEETISDIVSITVLGPDVYEADRFATAVFAMGKEGINFVEALPGFEGYSIDKMGIATMSSGFEQLTL